MRNQKSKGAKAFYVLIVGVFLSTQLLFPFAQATTVGVGLLETPDSILVTPNPATITAGENQQYVATAVFDRVDPTPDETLDVTANNLTAWDTSSAMATINTVGLAHGVSAGVVNVSATYGGVTGTAVLNVLAPPSPPPPPSSPPPGPAGGSEPTPPPTPPTPTPTPEPTPSPTPEPTPTPTPSPEPQVPPPSPGPPPPGEEFSPSPEGDLPPTLTEPALSYPPGEKPVIEVSSPPSPNPQTPEVILSPVFLPPELSVTRAEVVARTIQEFHIDGNKKELLQSCVSNINDCLSIFLGVTNFRGVIVSTDPVANVIKTVNKFVGFQVSRAASETLFNLGALQLYPDVNPSLDDAYYVNIASLLGIIQGYYEETDSPFKPYQVITRMEALKVLLNSTDLMKWLYYDELEATLGGPEGILNQKTPFTDVVSSRDYMWWYPRYINKACELGMITCYDGTSFRPDDYITEAELDAMIVGLKDYLDGSDFDKTEYGDPDNDTLKTYIENTVYFTNPNDKDTDQDELQDNEELDEFKTSPFIKDTDAEGLSDYEEVKTYKTNPLKSDTDEDNYSDSEEIRFNSDPLNPLSVPDDANGNGVADTWEQQYAVEVVDGSLDSDSDGVSDRIEYQVGTDPTKTDSDGDGFSDAQEILELQTDPLNPNDPGTIDALGVRITNFQEGQLVGDNTPLIKGIAPIGATVRLVLRNDYGHEKVLGDTTVDENNIFIFETPDAIRDGKYMLMAKAIETDKKSILLSNPVHVIIDSTLNVQKPAPKKLSDQAISDDVILKNLRIEIRDKKPVLVGDSEFGNKVIATWRSVVTTSALIADTKSGEFAIQAPEELPIGMHEVYVQATRKRDNAQSDTVKVLFSVGVGFGSTEILKGAAPDSEKAFFGFGSIGDFATKQGPLFWIIVVVILALAGGGVYYYLLSRNPKDKDKAKK